MNNEDQEVPPDFARRSVLAALGVTGLFLTEALIVAPLLWRLLEALRPERGELVLSLLATTAVALVFGWLIGRFCGDSKGIKAVMITALVLLPAILTAFGIKGFSDSQIGSLIPMILTVAVNTPGLFVGLFYGAGARNVA